MSVVQSTFVTVSCDGPDCQKTITFEATEKGNAEAIRDNAWLTTHRAIQTSDRRNLGYCSDECEAKGLATGAHNKLEQRIITGASSQSVDLAVRAAAQAKAATDAIKHGAPVTLG
ncbi:Uncharacterised protein [uncultured archaeon]|nr:Uncharacterised protein [uncultured archaeon]